jgi:hypothetical protein
VKITIIKRVEREKSEIMNTKTILNIVREIKLKEAIKEIIIMRRLLSKDIIFFILNEEVRLTLKRSLK